MKIKDLIKQKDILYQPVELDFQDGKKVINGPYHFCKKTKKQIFPTCNDTEEIIRERCRNADLPSYTHIAFHMNHNLKCLDVDWDEGYEESDNARAFVEYMKDNYCWKKSTTRKRGLHIFFKPCKDIIKWFEEKAVEKNSKGFSFKETPYPHMEFLSKSFCYEDLEAEVYNYDALLKDKQFSLTKLKAQAPDFNYRIIKDSKVLKQKEKSVKIKMDKVQKAISLLTKEQADQSKPEWIKLISQIKFHGDSYKEDARTWSKLSTIKYDGDTKFDKHWTDAKVYKFGLPLKKVANEECAGYVYLDFFEIFKNDWWINKIDGVEVYYIYNPTTKLWIQDKSLNLLKSAIGKYMNPFYDEKIMEASKGNAEPDLWLLKAKQAVNENTAKNNIACLFIQKWLEDYVKVKQFDSIDYLHQFENITLNTKDWTFRERLKEDMATMTASGLLLYPDDKDKIDEQILTWKCIIEGIFPEKPERDNWIQIYANSFSGLCLEKFIVLNGKGANGKSLINEAFKILHGDYYYEGHTSTLTRSFQGGAMPELANMSRKRLVVFSEPNEGDEINFSNVKSMTGKAQINARACHSNQTNTIMSGIKVNEVNKKLPIKNADGEAAIRRLIDILFSQTFKEDSEMPKIPIPGVHLQIPLYKEDDWLKDNISGLFYYIMEHCKENDLNYKNLMKIKLCPSIKKASKAYLEENNDILIIVKTYCEFSTENTDMVHIQDILEFYKQDETYPLLSRKQQRELGIGKFIKKCREDTNIGKYYVDEYQRKKGWIKCLRIKEEYLDINDQKKDDDKLSKGCEISSDED